MKSKYGSLKKGTVRADGKIFWSYVNGREWWVTPERYAIRNKLHDDNLKRQSYREYKRAYRMTIPQRKKLFHRAKSRAKRRGLQFDLELSDITIPSVCPVLGIPLVVGSADGAPSLDRVKSELGYVKGNVAVISKRANVIKSDATSRELFLVAKWAQSMGI